MNLNTSSSSTDNVYDNGRIAPRESKGNSFRKVACYMMIVNVMTVVLIVSQHLIVITAINVTNGTVVNATAGYRFCRAPNRNESDSIDKRYQNTCKVYSETWDTLSSKSTPYINQNLSTTDTNLPSDNLTEVRSLLLANNRSNRPEWLHRQQEDTSMVGSNSTTCTSEVSRDDYLSGECGPHCRPSCITLQLNVNQLHLLYDDMIMCPSDHPITPTNETNICSDSDDSDTIQNNKCVHTPRQQQQSFCDDESSLYNQYPSCYLEDAKCFGPTIYDDIVAVYENRLAPNGTTRKPLPNMEHCTTIPRDDNMSLLYQRFHDWPMVSPMKVECDENSTPPSSSSSSSSSCFNSSSNTNNVLYFEYCNIVEENYESCHSCHRSNGTDNGGKCDGTKNCTKLIKPFPPGWTTFVVSASIPYNTNTGSNTTFAACSNDVPYINETGVACFVQRIEIYYPEDCPYCHSCPNNIGLGDTFGPLEVIGFGHATITEHQQQQQLCSPCNAISKVATSTATSLSCSQLQECHETVDCSTGISIGIPSYIDNQCSFQDASFDDDFVQEDFIDDDIDAMDDDDEDDNEDVIDMPTTAPETKKPNVKTTGAPTTVPERDVSTPSKTPDVATIDPTDTMNMNTTTPTTKTTDAPSTTTSIVMSSKEFHFSPIIITFIVIGLIFVLSIQLIIYKQRVVTTAQQQHQQRQQPSDKDTEEIHYIEEALEFEGIDKILSGKESDNDGNSSQKTATDNNDIDDNNSQDPACHLEHRTRWGSIIRRTKSPQRRIVDSDGTVSSMCSVSMHSSQLQQPDVRYFQTASIVERSDQNEVEALYMTGQHHVQQR